MTIDAGNDKVEVTLKDVNIKADSGSALTSNGDVTLTLKGENHLTGGNGDIYGGDGITSSGTSPFPAVRSLPPEAITRAVMAPAAAASTAASSICRVALS